MGCLFLFQSNSFSDSDYEGEPVTKHPRLSGKYINQQDSSCSSDDSSSIEVNTNIFINNLIHLLFNRMISMSLEKQKVCRERQAL